MIDRSRLQLVPFDLSHWEIAAVEGRIERHLGRSSLFLKDGIAWVQGSDLTDGMIGFDIAFAEERSFVGGVFRVQDAENYEEFYLRPHQSGNPDANQYSPVFNGLSGWQLYHGDGYSAPVTYRFNEWLHVEVVFSSSAAEVYIDDLEQPALLIHELKREPAPGRVGLSSGKFGAAHFSRFSYAAVDGLALRAGSERRAPAPAGTVTSWRVSGTFPEASLRRKLSLAADEGKNLAWSRLECEETGLANLARLHGIGMRNNTVFARKTIVSQSEQVKKLSFGFSDRIMVYFNGRLIYRGDDTYRSRDYRFLGSIGFYDALYLPLVKGDNELWMAVSESLGGWGLQARFEDLTGIELVD